MIALVLSRQVSIPYMPVLSSLFQTRKPSAVRLAQQLFARRTDGVQAINAAVGNVLFPMHPRMQARLSTLAESGSPFSSGVVPYSASAGLPETQQTFLHILKSSGLDITGIQALVTDGGSQAMELVTVGLANTAAGQDNRPLLMFDPVYSNYRSFAERTNRTVISLPRQMELDGSFSFPDLAELEAIILEQKPGAIVIIPYDNPTGQKMSYDQLVSIAKLCVKHDLWLVSDEAYRELSYDLAENEPVSSIWALTEAEVPGVHGRRISIETASKVWNGCGLRIGALLTDNSSFYEAAVAEQTTNLCAPIIDQYIFASLLEENRDQLQEWYSQQRQVYGTRLISVAAAVQKLDPTLIVSQPAASLYLVIDFRNSAPAGFNTSDFVRFLAERGSYTINGKQMTLLVAPMAGFYAAGLNNPGLTQIRLAMVCSDWELTVLPELLVGLYREYLSQA